MIKKWQCSTVVVLLLLVCSASAQKVKTGYDKGGNFASYKTYSWAKLERPTNRPFFYQMVVNNVDYELQQRGLKRVEENGDLLLVPSGGVGTDFSVGAGSPVLSTMNYIPPSINASMWTGTLSGAVGTSGLVHEGTLMLALVDLKANSIAWEGTLEDKIDFTRKQETLKRIEKGVAKLFKGFPIKSKK